MKYPKWPIYAISVHKTELSNLTKNEIVLSPMHGGGGVKIYQSELFHVYQQIPMLWSNTPNRPNYFLDFTIVGPKKKVVVKSIYGYQNLPGEKYKTNEKN